jgi:hypothetical protein
VLLGCGLGGLGECPVGGAAASAAAFPLPVAQDGDAILHDRPTEPVEVVSVRPGTAAATLHPAGVGLMVVDSTV